VTLYHRTVARRSGGWGVEFFQRHVDDDAAQSVPGRDFLDKIPERVAARIVAVLEAVAAAPPPAYSGGGYWEAMHDEMAGFFEVRVDGPPNRTHYRLFCLLERHAEKVGLEGPSIAVITGKKKPFRSVLSKQDYAQVRRLGDEFRSRVPRSVLPRPSTRASE
jgi:hypothetical protein